MGKHNRYTGRQPRSISGVTKDASLYATVTIGLGVDSLRPLVGRKFDAGVMGDMLLPEETKANVVDREHLLKALTTIRRRQAGVAGGTLRATGEGFFEGQTEPTVDLFLAYFKSDREPSFDVFERNVVRMAEELAFGFAQKEIIVEVRAPLGHYVYRCSPLGFPAPGDSLDEYLSKLEG